MNLEKTLDEHIFKKSSKIIFKKKSLAEKFYR